ncbi:unnamed protein product [Didymodactylos carnosus]|uniref:Reverse transcriptase domain-containing protein n=1 Tax=Didymodactylos carnosus TaxID=1234261 RepID=A0A8S2HUQ5_9BILA|nr:unnamed protein product [Didymodactylos carnosus]CAF3680089.1 unnamed protein product [Didymodactylos carnosus]
MPVILLSAFQFRKSILFGACYKSKLQIDTDVFTDHLSDVLQKVRLDSKLRHDSIALVGDFNAHYWDKYRSALSAIDWLKVLDNYATISDKVEAFQNPFLQLSNKHVINKLVKISSRDQPWFMEWFKSYLANRQIITNVDGASSDLLFVTCGIPQGSVLGPLVFLIFIDDLPVGCTLIQYQAALAVTGAMRGTRSELVLRDLCWLSIRELYRVRCLCLFQKVMYGLTPDYLREFIPQCKSRYVTRNQNKIPAIRKGIHALNTSFIRSASRFWSELTPDLCSIPNPKKFKTKLVFQLLSNHGYFKLKLPIIPNERIFDIDIARCRLRFSQLNADLYARSLVQSPNCAYGFSETVDHFFLHCSLHNKARTDLTAELLKAGGMEIALWLHQIIVDVWINEEMVEDWTTAILIRLHKNKEDKRICDNYRGISL